MKTLTRGRSTLCGLLALSVIGLLTASCGGVSQETSLEAPIQNPGLAQLNKVAKTPELGVEGLALGTPVNPVPGFSDMLLARSMRGKGFGFSSITVLTVQKSESAGTLSSALGGSHSDYAFDVSARFCANKKGFPGQIYHLISLRLGGHAGVFVPLPGIWGQPALIPGEWIVKVRGVKPNTCVTVVSEFYVPSDWYDSSLMDGKISDLAPVIQSADFRGPIGYSFSYVYSAN